MTAEHTSTYTGKQRVLHWLVAVLVLTLLPMGFLMVDSGESEFWSTVGDLLYATHKSLGFIVIWLVVWRIALRMNRPAATYPSSMPLAMQILIRITHRWLYILLLATALLGWAGVTAYPALTLTAGLSIPPMPFVPQDEELSKQLFEIHGSLAIILSVLVALHIAGALKHKLMDRDGVFERMTSGN